MVIKFLSKALKIDKDILIIKKTDDEVTRFIKQKHIQSERKRFKELLEQEADRKNRGLNIAEKKLLYQSQINNM